MRVLISGGTGLIGQLLKKELERKGHEVKILSRSKGDYRWDIDLGVIDQHCLEGIDAIIHLAGAGIADKPWTASRKKELFNSRIVSTQLLFHLLKKQKNRVKTFISASAIGYYGADRGESLLNESSDIGKDFIGELTAQWEKESQEIEGLGIRTAQIRIGLVLTETGGYLGRVSRTIKWGIGSCLGSGKQWQSWIHYQDLLRLFLFSLENNFVRGPINGVAPQALRQEDLFKELAKQFNRPFFFPNIPEFFIKGILGELSQVVLGSLKVSSKKLTDEWNFSFKYGNIEKALQNILKK